MANQYEPWQPYRALARKAHTMETMTRSSTRKTRKTRQADPKELADVKRALKSLDEDGIIVLDGEFVSDGKARSWASLYRTALKSDSVFVRATAIPGTDEGTFRAAVYNA